MMEANVGAYGGPPEQQAAMAGQMPQPPPGAGLSPQDLAQLQQIEMLAEKKYNSVVKEERDAAHLALAGFDNSPDCIRQCQIILDHSQAEYALVMASSSLIKLVTMYWNNFTPAQTVDIRNYILNYLGRSFKISPMVQTNLITLVARVTKLGWMASQEHRDICTAVTKFLRSTVRHCILGFAILNELVAQMDEPLAGEAIGKHRKVAVAFRDTALFFIFQLAVTNLRHLHTKQIPIQNAVEEGQLLSQVLELVERGLSFDFIGTNPDEAIEDMATIQLPSNWKGIVEDPSTIQLFFAMYPTLSPPHSTKCLAILVLLASVRRSVFSDDAARARFINFLCLGTRDILQNHVNTLSDADNYHAFCRLLGRMKVNFQMRELVTMQGYSEWIDLTAKFTINSFKQWEWSSNSIHYLISLWSRLAQALPFSGTDTPTFLENFIPQIITAFISARLESIPKAVQNHEVSECFQEPDLSSHLSVLPSLCRFQYDMSAQYISSIMQPLVGKYKECLGALSQGVNDQLAFTIQVLEGQLATLIYVIGAVVGGHANTSLSREVQMTLDAMLSAMVLNFVGVLDDRYNIPTPLQPDVNLEMSCLFFMDQFRAQFIGLQTVPRLLTMGEMADEKKEATIYDAMCQLVGPSADQKGTLNLMLNKIIKNLRVWQNEKDVVNKCLEFLSNLSLGYHSSRLLATMDTAKAMLRNHTAQHFPFLNSQGNETMRYNFHLTLGRLMFDGNAEMFDEFMAPFEQQLQFIASQNNPRIEQVRRVCIGLCHDLTGVLAGARLSSSYVTFFEWACPRFLAILVRVLETWWDDSSVSTPILGFFQELVHNKTSRIEFESSSPNPIVLFKEAAKVINIYAPRLLSAKNQPVRDIFEDRVDGISRCIDILSKCMSGGYVNFGVFVLYNDKTFSMSLGHVMKLILSVSLDTLLSYTNVATIYFEFLEILFRVHSEMVLTECDSAIFLALFSSLVDGIHSFEVSQSSTCCQAIDNVFSWRHRVNRKKGKQDLAQRFDRIMDTTSDMVPRLFSTMFNMYVFEAVKNQWNLSRPIFSMIVANQNLLAGYQQQLAGTQNANIIPQLAQAFQQLMANIKPMLDDANRNTFTSQLSRFRTQVLAFLVRPPNLYT